MQRKRDVEEACASSYSEQLGTRGLQQQWRVAMTLRFQKADEIDREVNEERKINRWMIPSLLAFIVAVFGIGDWLRGDSRSFWEKVAGAIAFGWLWLLISPVYQEFRIRTKEIYGKVSAVEEKLDEMQNMLEQRIDELHQKIENKLESDHDVDVETTWGGTTNRGHLPADIATEADISRAVSRAIQETGATSVANMGLVIKTARSHLKGKRFEESELQSLVRRVDLFQRTQR